MADADDHPAYELGTLSQRVAGLEAGVRGIFTQIEGLSRQMADFSKTRGTNWAGFAQSAAAAVGMVFIVGGAIITPIISMENTLAINVREIEKGYVKTDVQDKREAITQDRLDRLGDFKESKETANALEKSIDLRFGAIAKLDELYDKKTDDRITELEKVESARMDWTAGAIGHLQADLVTRAENAAHWEEQTERTTAVVTSLNELRRETLSNFTIGDALKAFEQRLDRLQYGNGAVPAEVLPAPKAN